MGTVLGSTSLQMVRFLIPTDLSPDFVDLFMFIVNMNP